MDPNSERDVSGELTAKLAGPGLAVSVLGLVDLAPGLAMDLTMSVVGVKFRCECGVQVVPAVSLLPAWPGPTYRRGGEKVATALSVVVADMPDNVSGCSEVSVRRRNSHRDCESMSVSLKKWSRVEQTELVEGLRSLDS